MYRAFNVKFNPDQNMVAKYKSAGEDGLREHETTYDNFLAHFRKLDGALDATRLTAKWFPSVDAHVFISHAHANKDDALTLAGWLNERLGVRSFIDSVSWGYAKHLLRAIDDEYCPKGDGNFDYDKRNLSTAHVYMMLTNALVEMINQCEVLFFLNTPQSILPTDSINGGKQGTTSPWLFTELAMSRLIKERSSVEHRRSVLKKAALREHVAKALVVHYAMDMDHLTPLSWGNLKRWREMADDSRGEKALDMLYTIV